MTEARIGRLLPACLHQAIGDVLPYRIDFYEEWLDPDGLRDGTIGPAPMTAVLGFLRTEGDAYDGVMERAGVLAAEWTIASLPGVQRALMPRLPRALRARLALGVVRRIVRDVHSTSRASARVRGGQARIDVTTSLFCAVRDPRALPLCRFYAATVVETLRRFGIASAAAIAECRAVRGSTCVITIEMGGDAVHEARAA